jgi:hypothetical protein
MRIIVATAIVASCLAGASLAQNTTPVIQWADQPDARDFAHAYPDRAREERVAGYSLLCCSVLPNRRLSCEVAVAWPSNYGFDRAGRDVIQQYRLTEEAFASWPGGDARIRRGVVWRAGASTPELEAALSQIHDATKSTCMPAGAEAAPGVDDIVTTMIPVTIRR